MKYIRQSKFEVVVADGDVGQVRSFACKRLMRDWIKTEEYTAARERNLQQAAVAAATASARAAAAVAAAACQIGEGGAGGPLAQPGDACGVGGVCGGCGPLLSASAAADAPSAAAGAYDGPGSGAGARPSPVTLSAVSSAFDWRRTAARV